MDVIENAPEPLRSQILKNRQILKINRVPEHIKKMFIKIAEERYCNDYGMFLTVLLERYGKEEFEKGGTYGKR